MLAFDNAMRFSVTVTTLTTVHCEDTVTSAGHNGTLFLKNPETDTEGATHCNPVSPSGHVFSVTSTYGGCLSNF